MSQKLGQVYFAHNKQSQFLNPMQEGGGDYSEMTANLIDKEIRRIIDEQYEKALGILESNREILEQAAERLSESEVIEGEELKTLAEAVLKQAELNNNPETLENNRALAA